MSGARNRKAFITRGSLIAIAAAGLALAHARAQESPNTEKGQTGSTTVTEQIIAALYTDFVQFGDPIYGSPCTSSPCTMYSHSPFITSVDRINPGTYIVNFAAGRYTKPPSCTATGGGEPAQAFARIAALPTTTSFAIQFATNNGGIVDSFVSVICRGE